MLIAVFCAGLLPGTGAVAAGLSSERFSVSIRDQDVRDVLAELSSVTGVPILVSDQVSGRVSAAFDEASATELLDGIARQKGLDWRFDGRRVEVTALSEQQTRILDLGGVRLAELSSALDDLGVDGSRFPITAVDGEFAMIVAPPKHIAVVEVVLGALAKRAAAVREAAAREANARAERERMAREQEAVHLMQIRALEMQALREKELRARRRPMILRNGVWGG